MLFIQFPKFSTDSCLTSLPCNSVSSFLSMDCNHWDPWKPFSTLCEYVDEKFIMLANMVINSIVCAGWTVDWGTFWDTRGAIGTDMFICSVANTFHISRSSVARLAFSCRSEIRLSFLCSTFKLQFRVMISGQTGMRSTKPSSGRSSMKNGVSSQFQSDWSATRPFRTSSTNPSSGKSSIKNACSYLHHSSTRSLGDRFEGSLGNCSKSILVWVSNFPSAMSAVRNSQSAMKCPGPQQ